MRRILIIVATLLSFGLVANVAVASIPDSQGVIHGCRNNLLHTLSVRDDATQAQCPIGTTPLDWNQTAEITTYSTQFQYQTSTPGVETDVPLDDYAGSTNHPFVVLTCNSDPLDPSPSQYKPVSLGYVVRDTAGNPGEYYTPIYALHISVNSPGNIIYGNNDHWLFTGTIHTQAVAPAVILFITLTCVRVGF